LHEKKPKSFHYRASAIDRNDPVRARRRQDPPATEYGRVIHIAEIRRWRGNINIPVQVVPVEKLASLTRANHQGVIAFAGLVSYMDLQQVIDHTVGEGASRSSSCWTG
jgi:hypothetical protein